MRKFIKFYNVDINEFVDPDTDLFFKCSICGRSFLKEDLSVFCRSKPEKNKCFSCVRSLHQIE